MRRILLFGLAAVCSLSLMQAQTVSTLTNEQQGWLAKANRHDKAGWVYLHIEGAPRERGFQYGYLLAKEIKETFRVFGKEWTYQSSMEWSWLVERSNEIILPKVDAEILAEIDGMVSGMRAAGIQTTREELVALNADIDLTSYWWPTVKDTFKINSPEPKKESCSSFIATGSMTADGKIVLAHNTMTGYQEPFTNIVLDILPDKGHRIMMQAMPGFVHSGSDFFITDAGLVGSETTIGAFIPFEPNGVSEFVRMRLATQYASSIDEWCEIMKKGNNGGYANAWLLGDINTNEIARLELGLKYATLERKKDGYFIGSNVAEDIKILRRETKADEINVKVSGVARRVRWKQLMKQYAGKINAELAQAFEGDHFDTYLNQNVPSSRTLCAHWDLDSQMAGPDAPFDPSGTIDAKVVDSKMAKRMSFLARWGSGCGKAFDAKKYLEDHPQYEWMTDLLRSRPTNPWAEFQAGEH
jgi:hypothetical protein